MFEETTQFIYESSTVDTMPSLEAFWRGQFPWNSHSDVQSTDVQSAMYRYNREYSLNWFMSDSEWMLLTLGIDSKVIGSPFREQLPDKTINQRLWWDFLAEYLSRGVIGFRVQLAQALEELDQVVDEAQSEGYEIPSSTAIDKAEYIIKCIYDNLLHPFQVYPMPDGEVAIDVANGDGSSVLILCCSDGGTLCFVNINGNQRRAHYSNSDALPDGFMHEALEELQQNLNRSGESQHGSLD